MLLDWNVYEWYEKLLNSKVVEESNFIFCCNQDCKDNGFAIIKFKEYYDQDSISIVDAVRLDVEKKQ